MYWINIQNFRYGYHLYCYLRNTAEAIPYFEKAVDIWPHSDITWYWLGSAYSDLNEISKCRIALGKCLKISPHHPRALGLWRYRFGEYNVDSIEDDTKNWMLSGQKNKCLIRRFRDWNAKEFAIFWYHDAEFWLTDENDRFQHYYQIFRQKRLDDIHVLYNVNRNMLKTEIGIQNDQDIDYILECIHHKFIKEHERLKYWLQSVLSSKGLLDQFMECLKQNSIYSLDSFYRGISSKYKLIRVLGNQHEKEAIRIWNAYNILDQNNNKKVNNNVISSQSHSSSSFHEHNTDNDNSSLCQFD